MAVDSEEYEFDITQMPFPIHGLVQQICTLWDECNPNNKQKQTDKHNSETKENVQDSDAELKMQLVFDSNASDETYIIAIDKQVDILSKLYHFCVSAHMINQLSQPLNNHCLYSVLDSFVYVNFSSKQDLSKTHYASVQLTRFINNIFSDIIKNNRFLNESSSNLAMRNDLFLAKNKLLLSNFMDNVECSFGNDESLFVNDFIKFLTNKNKEEEDARHNNNENEKDNENDDKDDDASSMAETDIDSEYIGPLISGMNVFEYYFCFIVCCKFDNSVINMFCALMNVYFTNYKSETGIDISDVYINSIVNPNGIFYYLFKFVKTYYNGKYANNLVLLPLKNACNRSDWRSIVDFYCIAVFNGFQFEQGIIDNVSSFENDNKQEEEEDHKRAKSKGRNPFLVDDRELITCANQLITQSGCKPEMLRSLLTSKNFIVNDKRPPTLIEYTVLERVEAFKRNLEDTALATFLDTIEILNEYGCDFTNTNNNLMESAIEFNDVECVKTMIECCRKRDSSILPLVPFMDNDILMDEKKQELNEMNNNGSEMLRKMFGFKNMEAKRRIISKLIYATDVTMMAVLLECPEFAMKDVNDIERITSNFGLLPLMANVSVKKECKLWERFDRDKVDSIKDTAIKLWIRLQAQDQIATENGENGKYGKQVKACKTIVDTICQFCGINTSQEIANIDKKIEEASKKFREYKQLALGTKKNEDATNKDANVENASVATNLMRNVVSGNSRRFQGNGFDLDLTYITERIIAMGFPASALEGMYRNNIEDVAKFLSKRHSDKYMVYNLCSEKSYDHKIFDNRVVRFPFDDHNCPCFDDLPAFNEALDEWLSDNSENIAAIHCKNGMGRSGLVIASYLIHTGVWETAKDALKYFGISRTTNQKGVTVPSQRRWVYYYEKYMSLRSRGLTLPQSKWYKFQSIFVSKTCPSFKTCSVYNYEKKFDATNKNIKKTKGGFLITIESTFLINKDVKIQFITGGFRKTRAFSFWFNTMFIENDALKLEKDEIDKVNLDERAKNFYVEMKFEQVESKDKENDGYGDGGDDGAAWGTSQGDNEKKYDISKMTHEEIVLIGLQLADNIIIRNRTWKGEIYQDCFTGTDACKYLMKRLECSKTESIQFGEIFLTNGIISYVKRSDDVNDRQFLDGPFFYRFNYEMKEYNENEMTIENVWLKAVSEMNNGNQPQIAVANNVKIENLVSRRRGKPIEKQGLNDTDGDGNEQAPQLAGQNNQQLFEMMQQRRAFVAQDDDHVSDDGDYSDDSEGFG